MVLLKTDYNTKITEIEVKIPDISNLATKTALTTVENKIPDVSNLATKTALTTVENKIPDVNSLVKKRIITPELLRLILSYQALMVKLLKMSLLEKKFILFLLGNTIFDGEDGSQAYLIFQPVHGHFKTVTNTNYISSWKSKGLSAESIKPPTTSDNNLHPELSYYEYNIKVKFTGSCLKKSKITYTHKKW